MKFLSVMLSIVSIMVINMTITLVANVLSLRKLQLLPCPDKPDVNTDRWAQVNDFSFIGSYMVKGHYWTIFAWQHTDRSSFLCQYGIANAACDFTTKFTSDVSLTTYNKTGHLLPHRPGEYLQSFSKIDLNEQWNRHIEMKNYLMDVCGVELVAPDVPFEDYFIDCVHRQMEFVMSIPLWFLLGGYWLFVRRYLYHNKTIKEQYEKGMIRLLKESSGANSFNYLL
jgi:hypothetical protein